MDHESLFPSLFLEKSQTANFDGFNEMSLLNQPFDEMIGEPCGHPLRSVDHTEQPILPKMDFVDPEFCQRIQKPMELGLSPECKNHFEQFSEHSIRDGAMDQNTPLEFGGQNLGDVLKIKANVANIQQEADNLTEKDEPIEELKNFENQLDTSKKPRKDVSYKTILRKCRKFYQQRFNLHTGFLRNKKKEATGFYRECIAKFIEEHVDIKTNLNIHFHMAALLYPQEMIKRIESFVYPNGIKNFTPKKVIKRKLDSHKGHVEKLHDILYKFTHEKLDKFISVPELALLFMYYIEKCGNAEFSEEDEQRHIKDLTKRCKRSIGKSRKTKGAVTLFD